MSSPKHRNGEGTRRPKDPWLMAAVVVLSLGLAVELQRQPLAWSLGLLGALSFIGWMLAIAMRGEPKAVRRAALLIPPGLTVLMMGVDGLGHALPWSLLVLLALLAASPRCRRSVVRAVRWLFEESRPPQDVASWVAPAPLPSRPVTRFACPAAETLDVEALKRAWSTSYSALRTAPSAKERWRIAEIRRSYLDRLELLDPAGFDAWIRAGSDLARSYGTGWR